MKRRKEREFALQALYALEFNGGSINDLMGHFSDQQKKYASQFARDLIRQCTEHREKLDGFITPQLKNWEYGRVAVIDKILLRMAVAEFMYFDSVPPEATLNEMIEISKEFSTERSGKFINGIMDAILKKLRKDGKLTKSGRGLVSPGTSK